jgi:hypothetical protein
MRAAEAAREAEATRNQVLEYEAWKAAEKAEEEEAGRAMCLEITSTPFSGLRDPDPLCWHKEQLVASYRAVRNLLTGDKSAPSVFEKSTDLMKQRT